MKLRRKHGTTGGVIVLYLITWFFGHRALQFRFEGPEGHAHPRTISVPVLPFLLYCRATNAEHGVGWLTEGVYIWYGFGIRQVFNVADEPDPRSGY